MGRVDQVWNSAGMPDEAFKASLQTCFAPSGRRTGEELREDLEAIANNPLIDGLMSIASFDSTASAGTTFRFSLISASGE